MDTLASVWEGWRQATCMPGGCFCEAVGEGWLRQPVNTWSSLAFVLAAVWIGARRVEARLRGMQVVFAASAALVGLGSAFYHASLSFAGQFVDVLGMYLLSVPILLYRRISGRSFALAYAVLVAVLALLLWFVPELRRWLFAAVLVAGVISELLHLRRNPGLDARWFWAGLGSFALAFGVWVMDNSRLLCAPESLLQGHALWHLLGAAATAMLFNHYATERPRPGVG